VAIPNGVIFMWTGTNSTIPSGWSRVTDLDNKFPRVIDTGDTINATGGSATHTHTSPLHSHNFDDHTHQFTLSTSSGGGRDGGNGDRTGVREAHSHGTTTSGAITNAGVAQVAVTYSAVSNNPPYYEVIFITPTTYAGGLPNNAVSFMDGTDLKNLTLCDGNNSTPNLLGQFIKGANTSADAGGTGGSTTNSHTINHTHGVSHQHAAVYTATVNSGVSLNTPSPTDGAKNNHNHLVGLDNAALTSDTNSSISAQVETVIPPYVDLLIGQNKTGGVLMLPGMVGMWLGLEANIPGDWDIQTKYGRLLRGSNASNVGNTGGSATHSHASQSHTHTIAPHTHTIPDIYHINEDVRDSSGSTKYATSSTPHPASNSASSTANLQTGSTTADTANNMPEYRNVALIKYRGGAGGAFLFNLIR
jgi:hypothetical protein